MPMRLRPFVDRELTLGVHEAGIEGGSKQTTITGQLVQTQGPRAR